MRATERESVQKRIIHTRRFFLGFFPGPQTEGAVPSSAQKAVSLALWKAKRPRGHRTEEEPRREGWALSGYT